MTVRKIHDGGVLVFTPDRLFHDTRGYFLEAKRNDQFINVLHGMRFVQTNISYSQPFVLRGLHYQVGTPQGKLLRCINGKVYQVAVDVREGSETFGQWSSVILDSKRNDAVWVPPGFANGFYVFEEGAHILYEMTAYHDAASERLLLWSDQEVGIAWPFGTGAQLIMSKKDREAPRLGEIEKWKQR